jgi:hypothetical protein
LQAIIEINDLTPKSGRMANAIKASLPQDVKSGIKKLIGR